MAKKTMISVTLKGKTIPHSVTGHYGAGRVFLKPASDGTGVIAGGAVRAILEAVGVQNILTKSLGTTNPHNVVKATFDALQNLHLADAIFKARGRTSGAAAATVAEPAAEPAPAPAVEPVPAPEAVAETK
jgi:small subunit ribosomal protein S5